MRTPTRDPDSVRPSLWLFTAALLGATVMAVAWIVGNESGGHFSVTTEGRATPGDGEPRGRRVRVLRPVGDPEGRIVDHGPSGSVREAWAEASRRDRLPAGALPPIVEAIADPQMHAYRRSYADPSRAPFTAMIRRGRLTRAQGLDLPAGASCEIRVLPVADPTFNCLIRVTCGEVVVYPNRSETAGYVSCELEGSHAARAVDALTTSRDGDPALAFDARNGRVVVEDAEHPGGPTFEVDIRLDPGVLRLL